MIFIKEIIILTLFTGIICEKSNVCKTFSDYFHMRNNPNCWYNADAVQNAPDILKSHGYNYETHTVTTKDNYILTIFRLARRNAKEIIVLQPPLAGSSANYIKSGNHSLAFELYNAGYDVWLTNSRGCIYSTKHKIYTEQDYKYWDYSFHEIGIYDFPAEFEYVKSITKRNDFVVIAYSMTGTAAFIYSSLLQKHALDYVKVFILMAPSIYTRPKIKSQNMLMNINKVTNTLKLPTLFPSFSVGKNVIKLLCSSNPFKLLCLSIIISDSGGSFTNFDPALVPVLFYNMPTRIPYKLLFHYNQISLSKRFQFFDYGTIQNLIHYNTSTPPLYPLNDIAVPIYIIYGEADTSCTREDVNKVFNKLTEKAKMYGIHELKTYNHVDFLYSKSSKEKLVDHVLKFINETVKSKSQLDYF